MHEAESQECIPKCCPKQRGEICGEMLKQSPPTLLCMACSLPHLAWIVSGLFILDCMMLAFHAQCLQALHAPPLGSPLIVHSRIS